MWSHPGVQSCSWTPREEDGLGTLTHTLAEQIDELMHRDGERESLALSTTPTSVAIHDLAVRTAALEDAIREIALEVQKLLDQD